jgi:hypothetical protein
MKPVFKRGQYIFFKRWGKTHCGNVVFGTEGYAFVHVAFKADIYYSVEIPISDIVARIKRKTAQRT